MLVNTTMVNTTTVNTVVLHCHPLFPSISLSSRGGCAAQSSAMPATPIVLIADEAYVLGLAAALRSIEQHTQPLPPIYVIDAGIAPDSRLKLQQVADIQWIHASNIMQAELQRQGLLPAPGQSCDGHVSAACWLKLTLPQLLPSSVSKALYFDCDMLARTSLLPILQLDLGGAPALVTATSET